jgi:hypothetical protein
VGVFADPRISSIATCPQSAVGNHENVADRLLVTQLHNRGMDGTDVLVAVVDTGVEYSAPAVAGTGSQFR